MSETESADTIAATLLIVAKAPVPGLAKTRLMAAMSATDAATVAAAALLDTLDAALAAPFAHRVVAMTGALSDARCAEEIRAVLGRFTVVEQRGDGFGERLAHAHRDGAGAGPVVQIGMDTPQVEASVLAEIGRVVTAGSSRAVLGAAEDGGWWVLGLSDASDAVAVVDVPMSTDRTGSDTHDALVARGLDVRPAPSLRDADELGDLAVVAAACRPDSRFATTVTAVLGRNAPE